MAKTQIKLERSTILAENSQAHKRERTIQRESHFPPSDYFGKRARNSNHRISKNKALVDTLSTTTSKNRCSVY